MYISVTEFDISDVRQLQKTH
uniref:Uncharacterized protein n=1 Tax=Anguilla anguilla TaxID=7936 RepID=A0A0E9SQP0_ANGAN